MNKYSFIRLSNPTESCVNHYQGVPPELADKELIRIRLPEARLLLLVSSCSDGVYLYRYSEDGSYGGDTWHPNIEEAEEQANFEFGIKLGEWEELPELTPDPHLKVLELLTNRS